MPNDPQQPQVNEPVVPPQEPPVGAIVDPGAPLPLPPSANNESAAQPAAAAVQLPTMLSPLTPEFVKKLTDRLTQARDEHNVPIDPIMFNGSTILILVLTATAAFMPSIDGAPKWVTPLCAGLAGVFVAMERALGFGARWRYHRDMYYSYSAIIDMLEFYSVVPSTEQSKYVRDIFTALYAVRSRESAIPNAGATASPT